MPADTPMVELRSVTKRFGDETRSVLEGVSFRAHPGEFISLIGASGCGKSTLLRLLAGLAVPTTGETLIAGEHAGSSRAERAFIFQDATLLPWLTVRGNAELLLKLRGIPRVERRARVEETLALARIAPLADRYPCQLSGGEKMRVSLARALTLHPKLLLLDEPFAALDEFTREHLQEELLALRARQNWTAFFVTHSVAEAVFLSTRILVLSRGRIAHDIAVELPAVRDTTTRDLPAFHVLTARVSALLRAAAPQTPEIA